MQRKGLSHTGCPRVTWQQLCRVEPPQPKPLDLGLPSVQELTVASLSIEGPAFSMISSCLLSHGVYASSGKEVNGPVSYSFRADVSQPLCLENECVSVKCTFSDLKNVYKAEKMESIYGLFPFISENHILSE